MGVLVEVKRLQLVVCECLGVVLCAFFSVAFLLILSPSTRMPRANTQKEMAKNTYFQFKQFRINQESAAMKVGIDGVLLGAWALLSDEERILDIGTGTGLLALMAAQRTSAQIHAVEIEPEAAMEAGSNFHASPWSVRLSVSLTDFRDFTSEFRFDHILSNPPFFDEQSLSPDHKRVKARHSGSLSLMDLIEKAAALLNENGRISLVLPADKEESLREIAANEGLAVSRMARVYPDRNKISHRILVELSRNEGGGVVEEIYIRDSETKEYSEQYRAITRDFYLHF